MRRYASVLVVLALALAAASIVAAQAPARCPCCGQPLPAGHTATAGQPAGSPLPPGAGPRTAAPPTAPADSAAAATPPAAPAAPATVERVLAVTILGVTVPLLWVAAGLALVTVAVALYFLVVVPWRKRKPLQEAYAIIAENQLERFPDAEERLNRALTAGLRKKDIAEARFALAYVRARLGRYAEASTVIDDLRKSGSDSRETVYLELWLAAQQKRDEQVEALHTQHADTLGDLLDTRLMVGLSLLRLARLRWSRREVDGALHYFERLRQLGVLADEIPKHIDDHRIVFGLLALFERDFESARRHFTGAVESAQAAHTPTYAAELGLLLCQWNEQEDADIDDDLDAQIAAMAAARASGAPPPPQESQPGDAGDRALDDATRLLRNAQFWHAIVLLRSWLRQPARGGLAPADREELGRRLARVRETDAGMVDPDLVEGLIDYYFSLDDPDRKQQALETLERAIGRAVTVPEVLTLVDRETKLAALQREGLTRYLSIVKSWVANPGVPASLRQALKDRLQRHRRFRELGEIDVIEGDPDLAPSVADMQTRAHMLHKRITQLVRPRLPRWDPADADSVASLMSRLNDATEVMTRHAQTVEETEQALMLTTGEFLIQDEPDDAAETPAGDGGADDTDAGTGAVTP